MIRIPDLSHYGQDDKKEDINNNKYVIINIFKAGQNLKPGRKYLKNVFYFPGWHCKSL